MGRRAILGGPALATAASLEDGRCLLHAHEEPPGQKAQHFKGPDCCHQDGPKRPISLRLTRRNHPAGHEMFWDLQTEPGTTARDWVFNAKPLSIYHPGIPAMPLGEASQHAERAVLRGAPLATLASPWDDTGFPAALRTQEEP